MVKNIAFKARIAIPEEALDLLEDHVVHQNEQDTILMIAYLAYLHQEKLEI